MSFKPISEDHPSLFRATALNAKQFTVVKEIIDFCGKTLINRKELREAHFKLHGVPMYGPNYIVKNMACKDGQPQGMFELGKLKLSATAAKALVSANSTPTADSAEPPAVNSEPVEPATVKKGKKTVAKKGNKPASNRKGNKPVTPVPTATEPVEIAPRELSQDEIEEAARLAEIERNTIPA